MRVVLSGYYGFHNVGDEAILFSIIAALKAEQPDIEIVVLSNDPDYTKKTYQVEAVNRWQLKEVSQAIRSADGVISGGGSLLQDKTGNRSVIYYSGIMMIARAYKKPFVIYAQGIGPVDKKVNQRITKVAISKAKLVTVRDEASKQFLKDIGLKNEVSVVPDPVLGIDVNTRSSDWVQEQSLKQPMLAVSVRDWPSSDNYKEAIAGALDQAAGLGYKVVFVPMHGEHDAETSKEVAAMMSAEALISPHDASIEEKIAVIGESAMLVGMRLHALIFAAVVETPFLALSYDPKIDAFADLCQQPVAADVHDRLSAEELFEKIKQHSEQLEEEKQKMNVYVAQAKQEAKQTAARALACFR
ncbi:polysaccharide pyruvyl transferase CsaB [Desertibacillus haloalkaliphilus]|uniref:polysaccharide pyruvyl transferase CsaB n=1 Tax=Desertibacillus haloalkaliphilus TaxID=1328930 RepID=UPI001C27B6E9|nr:polysaccharide pyruvyl transferase CsaB [Desertibacillus haloalkaliphilus]MBU8905973.1 polysaccharide pyruvyl transferase CsaB [Desertibacillus haloalkaliphilus]